VENRKIFPPLVICVPAEGFPLELGTGAGSQKTRMMGLPGRKRSLMISSAVWVQCTNVTDRQTDRHRATAKTALMHTVLRGDIKLTRMSCCCCYWCWSWTQHRR